MCRVAILLAALAPVVLIGIPTSAVGACEEDGKIRCGRSWGPGYPPAMVYRLRTVREDPPGSGRCTYRLVPLPRSFSCESVGSKNPYEKSR